MRFKAILRNINLLNIALIAVIVLLANYTLLPLFNMSIQYKLPIPKTTIVDKVDKAEEPAQSLTPSPVNYTIVKEQNLFHPERKLSLEQKKEIPRPELVLYGTLISHDVKIAFMEDKKAPRNSPGRGKRQMALQLGNILSGYTLIDVYHDKVVMARDDDRIEVSIFKSKNTMHEQTVHKNIVETDTRKLKKQGSGAPPGVIERGPPPPEMPVPDKETLFKVKDAFEPFIRKKLGNQQTEKPN